MHTRRLLLLPLLAWTAVSAQVSAPLLQAEDEASGRRNQKIQRIRIEDDGARIDELRVGGQTQSITVQPKANVPGYEFQPSDLARSRPADHRDGLSSPGSQRVWNIMKF